MKGDYLVGKGEDGRSWKYYKIQRFQLVWGLCMYFNSLWRLWQANYNFYKCILPPRPVWALATRLIGPNFLLWFFFPLSLVIKISHLFLVNPDGKPNQRPWAARPPPPRCLHSGARRHPAVPFLQAAVTHRAGEVTQKLQMNVSALTQRQALPPDPLTMHWKSTSKVLDIHDACIDLLSL